MKLKIYSIAVMAFIGLLACSTANAQTPTEPVAPQAPATTNGYSGYSAYATPSMTYTTPSVYYYGTQPGDTVYRNKMNKLREQMNALNKQMSELSREQSKKLIALNQERMATMRKTISARFDSTFSRNLNRTFTTRSRYNYDDNTNIEKLLASGEVKEKSKVFTKSYPVDGNDKLQIDNTFGKITVNTWPKNEFKVEVTIKGYANDDNDAQKLIDKISIVSSKDNNVASFKTVIENSENDSWSGTRIENGKVVKVRKTVISYVVYMPVKSALSIANKFGATILPALDGKITIDNQYGKLDAKALSNSDNVIHLKFVDANLTSLNGSDLKVEYGSLNLDAADRLNAKLSFTPVKIGKLTTSGVINVKYGDGLVIGDMDKNLKTLTVNSSFAPVKLGSLNDTNADFDVTVHNAEFMYNNADVNVTSKTPDNERGYTFSKTYKGHIGKGSTDKVITINASYGPGVKFEK